MDLARHVDLLMKGIGFRPASAVPIVYSRDGYQVRLEPEPEVLSVGGRNIHSISIGLSLAGQVDRKIEEEWIRRGLYGMLDEMNAAILGQTGQNDILATEFTMAGLNGRTSVNVPRVVFQYGRADPFWIAESLCWAVKAAETHLSKYVTRA